jgi:hypothetical protein
MADGLTVCLDYLPQIGKKFVQLLGNQKEVVAAAARALSCGDLYTPKPYSDIFAENFCPGVHPVARVNLVAAPGLRALLAESLMLANEGNEGNSHAANEGNNHASGQPVDSTTMCVTALLVALIAGVVSFRAT